MTTTTMSLDRQHRSTTCRHRSTDRPRRIRVFRTSVAPCLLFWCGFDLNYARWPFRSEEKKTNEREKFGAFSIFFIFFSNEAQFFFKAMYLENGLINLDEIWRGERGQRGDVAIKEFEGIGSSL